MRKLSNEELELILNKHVKWLNNEDGGERADLSFVDLEDANLEYANLRSANLRSANLEDANLDFSCLPLWCGGLNFKIDEKIAKQIMYHLMNLMKCSEIELKEYFKEKAFEFVNTSHVVSIHDLPEFEVPKK